jgi:hypothetical protein
MKVWFRLVHTPAFETILKPFPRAYGVYSSPTTGTLEACASPGRPVTTATQAFGAQEPGVLKFHVLGATHLDTLAPDPEELRWTLALTVAMTDFKAQTKPQGVKGADTVKDRRRPRVPESAPAAPSPPEVEWGETFSAPIHWSPAQARAPVLECTLSSCRPGGVPVSHGKAWLDLAPLLLKPLQLIGACLPITHPGEPPGAALVQARAVYVSQSGATGGPAERVQRRLTARPQAAALATPAGHVQVQLLSLTKIRRTCLSISSPLVGVGLLGAAGPVQSQEFRGSVSAFGDYSFYFDGAEAVLAVGAQEHTLILEFSLRDGDGPADLGAIGVLRVPLLEALTREGHVLDLCYPLRQEDTALKLGDLRLSLQFVPDGLLFVKRRAAPGVRRLRVKVYRVRGLNHENFPGRKDPYVEARLLASGTDGGARGPREGVVRSSVVGDAFENISWDEVLEVPIPEDADHVDGLELKVRSAVVCPGEGRGDLLGTVNIPWSDTQFVGGAWYSLTHPTKPALFTGDVRVAFLGEEEGGEEAGAGAGALDDDSGFVGEGGTAFAGPAGAPGAPLPPQSPSHDLPLLQSRGTRSITRVVRCEQLALCGPGFLVCRVLGLESVMPGSLRVGSLVADSVYVKVRRAPEAGAGGGDEEWSMNTGETKEKLYYLCAELDRGAERRAAWRQHLVAPLSYGGTSVLIVYFGTGRNPTVRKWLRAAIDPSSCLAHPGKEFQQWKLLSSARPEDVPATTGPGSRPPSPGTVAGPEPGAPPTAGHLGRAQFVLRYVPHSVGTLSVRLWDVSCLMGPEAALCGDPTAAFVTHRLFVRVRIAPGGLWAASSSRDAVLPRSKANSKGRPPVSLSWAGEEVLLQLDTTTLPLLKNADLAGPVVELALFNNQAVLENCLGRYHLPLPELLCSRGGGDQAQRSLPMLHALSGEPIGTFNASVSFAHLSTPAKALSAGATTTGDDVTEATGTGADASDNQVAVSRALRDLKRLFYTLDRDNSGSISQEELLAYLERPPSGNQEDLQDAIRDLLRRGGGGTEDMDLIATTRQVFKTIDANGDGNISWEEWVSFLEVLRHNHGDAISDVGLIISTAAAIRHARDPDAPSDPSTPRPTDQDAAGEQTARSSAPPATSSRAFEAESPVRTLALPLRATTASEGPAPSKPKAAPPPLRPGRPILGTVSVEAVVQENARLRRQVQALEEEARAQAVKARKQLDAERAKFRREMDMLQQAARGQLGSRPPGTWDSRAFASPDAVLKTGTASEPQGEVLHLQVLNDALQGANAQLQGTVASLKGEMSNALLEVDVLKSQLREATARRDNDQFASAEIRRLEAARRQAFESRSVELRSLLTELEVQRQEVQVARKEAQVQKEAAVRARRDLEEATRLLGLEKKQNATLQASIQRYQVIISVAERDKIRSKAALALKTQYVEEEVTQRRLLEERKAEEEQRAEQAAQVIQAGMKGFVVRRQRAKYQSSAVRLQACGRSFLAAKKFRRMVSQRTEAAINIQRIWRGFRAYRYVQARLRAVVTIQSVVRGGRERKVTVPQAIARRQQVVGGATTIQSAYRTALAYRRYGGFRRAVMIMQAKFRLRRLRKEKAARAEAEARERERAAHEPVPETAQTAVALGLPSAEQPVASSPPQSHRSSGGGDVVPVVQARPPASPRVGHDMPVPAAPPEPSGKRDDSAALPEPEAPKVPEASAPSTESSVPSTTHPEPQGIMPRASTQDTTSLLPEGREHHVDVEAPALASARSSDGSRRPSNPVTADTEGERTRDPRDEIAGEETRRESGSAEAQGPPLSEAHDPAADAGASDQKPAQPIEVPGATIPAARPEMEHDDSIFSVGSLDSDESSKHPLTTLPQGHGPPSTTPVGGGVEGLEAGSGAKTGGAGRGPEPVAAVPALSREDSSLFSIGSDEEKEPPALPAQDEPESTRASTLPTVVEAPAAASEPPPEVETLPVIAEAPGIGEVHTAPAAAEVPAEEDEDPEIFDIGDLGETARPQDPPAAPSLQAEGVHAESEDASLFDIGDLDGIPISGGAPLSEIPELQAEGREAAPPVVTPAEPVGTASPAGPTLVEQAPAANDAMASSLVNPVGGVPSEPSVPSGSEALQPAAEPPVELHDNLPSQPADETPPTGLGPGPTLTATGADIVEDPGAASVPLAEPATDADAPGATTTPDPPSGGDEALPSTEVVPSLAPEPTAHAEASVEAPQASAAPEPSTAPGVTEPSPAPQSPEAPPVEAPSAEHSAPSPQVDPVEPNVDLVAAPEVPAPADPPAMEAASPEKPASQAVPSPRSPGSSPRRSLSPRRDPPDAAITVVERPKPLRPPPLEAAATTVDLSAQYVGRKVRLRLDAGMDADVFLATVQSYDKLTHSVVIAFDDDPRVQEVFPVDSEELEWIGPPPNGVPALQPKTPAPVRDDVDHLGAFDGERRSDDSLEPTEDRPSDETLPAETAQGVGEEVQPGPPPPPKGPDCVGWEVELSIAGDDGEVELFIGNVVDYDAGTGSIKVYFPQLDDAEQLSPDEDGLRFIRYLGTGV